MMRRPPGQVAGQRKLFLALAFFLLNPALRLVDAQQQQQQPQKDLHVVDPAGDRLIRQVGDQVRQSPLAASVIDSIDDDNGDDDENGNNANVGGSGDRDGGHVYFGDDSDDAGSDREQKEPESHPNIRKAAASHVSPAEGKALAASRLTVETSKIQRKKTLTEEGDAASGASTGRSARLSPVPINKDGARNNNNNNTPLTTTVAPDLSVRAPSLAHRDHSADSGLGLASPHTARSLEDWEVEDFVLLATVDGDLHSVDRKTGKVLWHIENEKPVVDTTHHRAKVSVLDENFSPLDHWTWAVEPSGNGAIYLMIPGSTGLAETGLTMKAVVEQMPYYDRNHPVVFIGTKESTMMTLDAATGRVREWYGSGDADADMARGEPASCMRPNDFDDSNGEECAVGGTITLGRTDYKVSVRRTDGLTIATLKYSEWGPNNYDNDLHRQYRSPRDNRYVTGKPNGDVYGFSFDPNTDDVKLSFTYRLATPVARVFDIARPPSVPLSSNPDLALLPQPPPPPEDDDNVSLRRASVFVNETEAGGWYALSGTAYPLIVDVPPAECTKQGWWDRHQEAAPAEHRSAIAGKHMLAPAGRKLRRPMLAHNYPTLPGGDRSHRGSEEDYENGSTVPLTLPGSTEQADSVITKVKELPQVAANRVFDFISNPVLLVFLAAFAYFYSKDIGRWFDKKLQWSSDGETAEDEKTKAIESDTNDTGSSDLAASVAELPADREGLAEDTPITTPTETSTEAGENEKTEPLDQSAADSVESPDALEDDDMEQSQELGAASGDSSSGLPGDALSSVPPPLVSMDGADGSTATDGDGPAPEKKKAHRGRRGGAKHRKGNKTKSEASQSRGDDGPLRTVDELIGQAKQLGERTHLEPDILTVSNDMQEVSDPIVRMGSLIVDENVRLGSGSNGTIVFAGQFDGRDVAVKRILNEYFDMASQETKLLRESDDHPNVIRYFAQQERKQFHYIALELCKASLAQVIEKPQDFAELAQAGERDLPNVLYQITTGLSHLHSRSIVHRDLKPQNILVNMGLDGRPRMLISDFGLCKKLEGGQSSFGATTAHAAGTSGWRAPELLLDDDARDSGQTMVDVPLSAQSGSSLIRNADGTPGSRRATKAIDIFSLGLVFYYVLTKGLHPYDCGDRYMREVNIRKDTYNLSGLDVLGDFAYEAKDLVEEMISWVPQKRPRARAVLSHPFFWSPKKRLGFLCDVSDHFEKEQRDPPSDALRGLEAMAPEVCRGDFLRRLPKEFVDSLGRQRKYTGSRLLDLLRALRNKRNHFEDMPEPLRKMAGPLPEGYLGFWARRFPNLLIRCWRLGIEQDWAETDRFGEYYQPAGGV